MPVLLPMHAPLRNQVAVCMPVYVTELTIALKVTHRAAWLHNRLPGYITRIRLHNWAG